MLSNSLKSKNLSQFWEAINTYNANPETVDSETFISVFDKCCQTPGHEEFIKACIKGGCDVNKVLYYLYILVYNLKHEVAINSIKANKRKYFNNN